MIVSVVVAVFVQFPISGFVEWGIRCVRVRKSAVKVGVSCATSDSVVGDAQIKDKVTRACRVGEVADDFKVSALEARAWGHVQEFSVCAPMLDDSGDAFSEKGWA